jgi:glyoxylase I family protein|tara:strand:+ start:9492 stop:9677 length:186 start_codon:yes stop_codon:yes gene_type:complete
MCIYFHDPGGLRLEFTADTCPESRKREFEGEVYDVLTLWNEIHDWSQREKLFGSKSGYVTD